MSNLINVITLFSHLILLVGAQHLRWAVEEVAGSLQEPQPRQRRGPRWLAWAKKPLRWLAGRPWTLFWRAPQPDVGVLLQVDGEGLGHVTHVGVRALDGTRLYPAEVCKWPAFPTSKQIF
jgi:hypothetical protein